MKSKISVIVCAAGKGERAHMGRNKLLVPFCGANALYHTLSAVRSCFESAEIIVTSSPQDFEEISAICKPFGCKVIYGGETRTQSVYNALKSVTQKITLIHDGARPFTSAEQFRAVLECVEKYGSAICASPATDTTAIAENGFIKSVPPRSAVYNIQTPQGFYTKDILSAYEKAIGDGNAYTDDGSLYSRYVSPAKICPCGTALNKKMTFKEDFTNTVFPAPYCANQKADLRTGIGVDVHSFGKKQNFIKLCGVEIPSDEGLIAHSDGDAALHAVMDAVLSAAGLKDIGNYFPDSDPSYKDADSAALLKKVLLLAADRGLKVNGLSVAVQAEKPKLSPYIDKMITRLSAITGADRDRISITAGTCEGLGFVGEGRGVCVYCIATLCAKEN